MIPDKPNKFCPRELFPRWTRLTDFWTPAIAIHALKSLVQSKRIHMARMDDDTTDIDAQIAALQVQKARKLAQTARLRRDKEKEEASILIGSTPTKAPKSGKWTALLGYGTSAEAMNIRRRTH